MSWYNTCFNLFRVEHKPPWMQDVAKLNLHKTFRRHLLNVLCTFNLRSASRGQGNTRTMRWWLIQLKMIKIRNYYYWPDSSIASECYWVAIKFSEMVIILLKSDSHFPKKNCFICFNENPLKMMKNVFYFIIKALHVLKLFKFLSRLFGHVKTA